MQKPSDRLKYLKGNLTEVIKKLVRLESDVMRFRLEMNFYKVRVDLIRDNLDTLKTGTYVVSMTEYRFILRDYYYNRHHYCSALIDLMKAENDLEILKVQQEKIEDEMDLLIKDLENQVTVIPFRKRQ